MEVSLIMSVARLSSEQMSCFRSAMSDIIISRRGGRDGLLLNDNYSSSGGASVFYNLVLMSTFLCKGSRHTHTHTRVKSGGRTAHADLILSDKSLWGMQRKRGRWRGEREMSREMGETLQGPLLPTMAGET